MKFDKHFIILAMMLGVSIAGKSQISVSGIVTDRNTGEKLIGATILETGTANGALTDHNGFFIIRSLNSSANFKASFIGYNPVSISFEGKADTIIHISLIPGTELEEVIVRDERLAQADRIRMAGSELQTIPSLSGKPDLMKALHLLPGIQNQSEGSSLLLVRGGNPGENLYLFDHVPIIYVNHLGGFLSVFNPDIINNVDVLKGSFPARYGGKLSSVVAIAQKEGNANKLLGSYHIGITDISGTLEGPLKNKASFIITGRKTLFDLLLLMASSLSEGASAKTVYGFHDINGKISWKPNAKNSLHLNLFQVDDYMNFSAKTSKQNPANTNCIFYIWGNRMVSGAWKHMVSSRLYGENIIAYSSYRLREQQSLKYQQGRDILSMKSKSISSVQAITLISAWKFNAHRIWNVEFGLNNQYSLSLPAYFTHFESDQSKKLNKIHTNEAVFFADNNINLPFNFTANAGFRITHYSNSSFHKTSVEPRISLRKQFGSNQQLSIGYMVVNQFSHLLFTSGAIMNNEIWVPAGSKIKPAYSNQISFSWLANFKNNRYQAEISFYYKTLNQLATYKEGFTSLKGDANWNSKIETGGKGIAYGIEFWARKNVGKLNGFVSYSWSKSNRQFPFINGGKPFVFDFDRPHNVSISINYKFNSHISLNTSWVYHSGLPYTPAIGRQLSQSPEPAIDGIPFIYETLIYGKRNSARMRDYHRLDISVSYNYLHTDNSIKSTWSIGLYNAYNRNNPVYYYYNDNASGELFKPQQGGQKFAPLALYQLSLFPIIPTISYKRNIGNINSTGKRPINKFFNKLLYHE
ncbi:MAG: carboxypeptidase-like regulatory domain-containing protein [Bacteroidales bacterium]|nr:carboxypeptidase-like regulatory domain-containing protein [Bacteroidales bacterium]